LAIKRVSSAAIVEPLPLAHGLAYSVQRLVHFGDARTRFHQRSLRLSEHVHRMIEILLDPHDVARKACPFG
jgi:hypothetical protein